jgi:hypothetical protein
MALDVLMVPTRFMAKIPGASYTGFGFDSWDMALVFVVVMVLGYALYMGFTARNALCLAMALCAYFGKRTAVWALERNNGELIVFENRGLMAAVVRTGQRLDVLSPPISMGRADTLRQAMRNYENRYRIGAVNWHFFVPGDSVVLPCGRIWRHALHNSYLYDRQDVRVNLLWFPDTAALIKGQNISRQSYLRYLEGKNVILLKNNFIRPEHDAGL